MQYQLPDNPNNIASASLSSMVDIVFLLIIFFVVTASFDREQVDANIILPTIQNGAIKSLPQERLMLNVFANGSVKVGFHSLKAIDVSAKLGILIKSLKANKKTVFIINGDKDTPHKFIAEVMNSAAKAGYSNVRINAVVESKE